MVVRRQKCHRCNEKKLNRQCNVIDFRTGEFLSINSPAIYQPENTGYQEPDDRLLPQKKRVVYVATDAELENEHYYNRLWLTICNLPVPRRKMLDELSFLQVNYPDIEIRHPNDEPYEFPDIDEVFGDDPDMRWYSHFKEKNKLGGPKRRSRKLERLRLIDLYIRVKYPQIFRHIKK